MLGFGAAGLALIAIYAMLQPVTRVVEAATIFLVLCFVWGLGGTLYMARQRVRSKAHPERPELADAVERAASQAAGAGTKLSEAGLATGRRLLPSIKYLFSFEGRVMRREYWIAQIVTGIVVLGSVIWIIVEPSHLTPWLFMLISGVSLLAFGVRRTRDTGVNQWWFLLVLVAPVNLALLVFLLLVPTDEFRDAKI